MSFMYTPRQIFSFTGSLLHRKLCFFKAEIGIKTFSSGFRADSFKYKNNWITVLWSDWFLVAANYFGISLFRFCISSLQLLFKKEKSSFTFLQIPWISKGMLLTCGVVLFLSWEALLTDSLKFFKKKKKSQWHVKNTVYGCKPSQIFITGTPQVHCWSHLQLESRSLYIFNEHFAQSWT